MNRRHFVRLTGTLGGLIGAGLGALASTKTRDSNGLNGSDGTGLDNPSQVFALLDSGWTILTASGGDKFTGNGVDVSLIHANGILAVYIGSPTQAIKGVRLVWPIGSKRQRYMLGDRWERSYGDLGWVDKDAVCPWYVILVDRLRVSCFGVKTNTNAFCSWAVSPDGLELLVDTQSAGVGVRLGDRQLHAADIVTASGLVAEEELFALARQFCRQMCDKPRLPIQPVYGINDWYYAYGNNNPALILEQTRMMSEMATDTGNRPFSVIDAGWAAYSPLLPGDCCWQEDFSRPNEKFRDMGKLAGQIKAAGMRPGLWTRPLCARHDDPANLLLPKIPGRDDPRHPVLDPTIEENLARIGHNISTYRQWGFDLVKHDFTTYDITGRWGFQMIDRITEEGWRFHNDSLTTVEVIRKLYESIRDTAGDMYLIGCNTLSHPSAGLFELNRIGDDTSGKEWARTRKMGVNTLGFRMIQHKTFYSADGDCVGLTNQVPWGKNKQWMQLLAESSTPLFISAEPSAVGAEQRTFIKTCFAQAATQQPVGEPLDWFETQWPTRWRLNGREVRFEFDDLANTLLPAGKTNC